MKRALTLAFVASLMLAMLPAHAGGDDRVTIQPDPVDIGGTLTIVAEDCESGDGWTAKLKVTFENADGQVVRRKSKRADEDGTTRINVRITNEDFDKGTYTVIVRCKHRFSDGTSGTWYEITKTVKVRRPSD